MKILADSNVFIDFWKKPTQEIVSTFTNEDVVICGVVRSELMHGAKSGADFERICEMLDEFEELSFGSSDSDWADLGKMLYELRVNGVTVPFQDAVIALVAMNHHIPLWTKDKHFLQIQRIMKQLVLF